MSFGAFLVGLTINSKYSLSDLDLLVLLRVMNLLASDECLWKFPIANVYAAAYTEAINLGAKRVTLLDFLMWCIVHSRLSNQSKIEGVSTLTCSCLNSVYPSALYAVSSILRLSCVR
jgi:hypothetical protein